MSYTLFFFKKIPLDGLSVVLVDNHQVNLIIKILFHKANKIFAFLNMLNDCYKMEPSLSI